MPRLPMQPGVSEPVALAGSPVETLLSIHGRRADAYPVLLESAASGTSQGRYSLLLGAPGERLFVGAGGLCSGPGSGPGFLQRLDRWWQLAGPRMEPGRWPFCGGWFLLLGYELAGEIEPRLSLPAAPPGEGSVAWRMHGAIIHDHATGESAIVAEPGHEGFVLETRAEIAQAAGGVARRRDMPVKAVQAVVEEDPERFLAAVRAALAYIAAGDIYQANLSRRWTATLGDTLTGPELYRRLRNANPGPFAGIADLGGSSVLSSSPERLVRVQGRHVETRPIAGTRPRLGLQDAEAVAALVGDPKERAEHIMLVDLERNDLGRLCVPGTVRVDELMSVESYAHVHHIVSNVHGTLREEVTPVEVVRAMFPGGTITGCPKVRCMQLIGALEGSGRGAYTGSMGYLSLDGSMDLNILIRTLTVKGETAVLRAGGGIVADSDPHCELEETRAKARGVLRALEEVA